MKPISFHKGILLFPFLISTVLTAQSITSFDLGAIRQKNHQSGGMSLGGFYHINEQLLGGMEVNRFFPVHRITGEEDAVLSGWDVEMNFHYLVPVSNSLKLYPVTGISHTSEKESDPLTHEELIEKFWSLNTGAGVQVQWHNWLPHVEYLFSWGKLNQQFVLLGVGYEIEWRSHKKERPGK